MIGGDGGSLNAGWKMIVAVGGGLNVGGCGGWKGGDGRRLLLLLLGLFFNNFVRVISMSTIVGTFYQSSSSIFFSKITIC